MNRTHQGAPLILALGVVTALVVPSALAEKLPVYKLAPARIDRTQVRDLFTKALGASPEVKETETAIVHRSGNKVLEVDKRSGHIFMGDLDSMWNPMAKPVVTSTARAQATADSFLRDHGLLPAGDERLRVSFSHYSETGGGNDTAEREQKQILDRQVNYKVELAVRGPTGQPRTVPVVGGGAKFKVAVGDQDRVVGFLGGWRSIAGIESEEEILPQTSAEAEFKKRFADTPVKVVASRLAYYAAPAFEEQTVLAPVWIVGGQIQVGQHTVPVREAIIAATKYGPKYEPAPRPNLRGPKEAPPPRDADEKPTSPQGRLSLPGRLADVFLPTAHANPAFECGTSWIGPSQGLGGSPGNKQGFVDQCRAAGWAVIFDWGESAAWESDWNRDDDNWVDAADLVFYTGHASQDGWVLNKPDDTFLNAPEVGSTPGSDIWGNTDVEWIIIAACGPHQSTHFTTNTTNAFNRWRGSFDGLHVFLGYGAVTYDNSSEGRRFMELARAGWNVIDAWFRTAWEIQPSTNDFSAPDGPTIWVTAMYAHNGSHCQRNDHLWGMGSSCPDVVGPGQQRYLMWSGT